MILYKLFNSEEQDPKSQTIFKRRECYLVRGNIILKNMRLKIAVATSTHLTINNSTSESNKYLLKVFLVRTLQSKLIAIENTENSFFEIFLDRSHRQ
ncbi:7357_t:CDS:2 [Scutellospora calospora]|uniref:7357_t:CDS:1 n=1 Tax=Scutellospora calospora TaxID=85575 RepID=A0ACA9K3B3_9GLOM|nr:7357_t:CDS:2 [Scutellospora calospora]